MIQLENVTRKYGKKIAVDLIDWIRDQRKFDGVESLKSQLARDIEETKNRFDADPSRPLHAMT